jgi:hypothetical protein
MRPDSSQIVMLLRMFELDDAIAYGQLLKCQLFQPVMI